MAWRSLRSFTAPDCYPKPCATGIRKPLPLTLSLPCSLALFLPVPSAARNQIRKIAVPFLIRRLHRFRRFRLAILHSAIPCASFPFSSTDSTDSTDSSPESGTRFEFRICSVLRTSSLGIPALRYCSLLTTHYSPVRPPASCEPSLVSAYSLLTTHYSLVRRRASSGFFP
jgi:hypothetical protein